MNQTHKTVFIITSLTILAAFFLFALFFNVTSQDGQITPVDKNTEAQQAQLSFDPLITPARVIYESYINASDVVRGNQQAALSLLVFGDFECAYCQEFYSNLNEVWPDYSNRVRLVWKDFPNPSHLNARSAAMAARCADEQGYFWEYYDSLFENQSLLSRELYNMIALDLELDLPRFNQCLDTKKTAEKVGEGMTQGQELGVDATPYIFIGNRVFDYALSADELRQILDEELD